MTTERDQRDTPTAPPTSTASTNTAQSRPVGPVDERKLDRNRELANALPAGTREDIDQLQTQLQGLPEEQVAATVEELRAAPDEALDRLRRGDEIVPAPNPPANPAD